MWAFPGGQSSSSSQHLSPRPTGSREPSRAGNSHAAPSEQPSGSGTRGGRGGRGRGGGGGGGGEKGGGGGQVSTPSPGGRGGGSHRSISPEFSINPVTGTLSLSLPVHTSPGRSEFGPSLSLSYDSGSGNGPFGVGWHLSTQSISRKTSKGIPHYDQSDVFRWSSVDDLVPVAGPVEEMVADGVQYRVQRYKPRVETDVHRIECWTRDDDADDVHWRTVSPENHTTFFGEDDQSRIFDEPDDGEAVEQDMGGKQKRIFSWLACRAVDSSGNAISWDYKSENSQGIDFLDPADSISETHRTERTRSRMKYLKRIRYGNVRPSRDPETWNIIRYTGDWMFEVVFDYGDHKEIHPSPEEQQEWALREYPHSVRTSGFELRTYRLCQRILLFHRFPEEMQGRSHALVASTALKYTHQYGVTLLSSLQATGYAGTGQGQSQSQPPLQFEYTAAVDAGALEVKEVPRDTLHQMSSATGWKTEWIDLDGEGAPGSLFAVDEGAWWYQRNELLKSSNPHTFGPLGPLPFRPNTSKGGHYFEDLNSDGRLNVVCLDSGGAVEGYYERADPPQWDSFQTFASAPRVSLDDEATRRVDLTGDGLADILRQEVTGELMWYPCLGKEGFGVARRLLGLVSGEGDGPRLISHDPRVQVYLADMTGDGLADIVEVLPGKTSYWPNLGHGRFGRRVTMGTSPTFDAIDCFSHSRIRLADVCGSGTTDLVYLSPGGGLHVYFNLAGNRWSDVMIISNFPALDSLSSVFTLDLLGKGTSCICWSGAAPSRAATSTLRYLELTGGNKPYLMSSFTNGMGVSTSVSYQPSTKYYLDDEQKGDPWRTRLHFPVQCVSQLVVEDHVAQSRKTARYAYHDGCFDGVEREFRGFGIVERWDEERFGDATAYLQRPPIRTKVWYHTGKDFDLVDTDQTRCESQLLSSSHKLPPDRDIDEHYDIYRALNGQKLREEVYSDDGSVRASTPYFVGEFSYEVHRVQRAMRHQCGVYRVSSRETVKTIYERQAQDPRTERGITLQTNVYGDILRSVAISAGRRKSPLLDLKDRQRQEATWAVYSEHTYTDAVAETDCYQKPQLACSRQFVVSGLKDAQMRDLEFLVGHNGSYFSEMEEIPYTTVEEPGTPYPRKSLVQEQRIYFLNGRLSEPLKLGMIEPFSIPDRTYQAIFEEGQLEDQFVATNLLDQEGLAEAITLGGYVSLPGDGRVWAPSARSLFSRDSQENLEQARRSFYQPSITIDAFGGTATQEWDRYQYLPRRMIDAVGNTVTFDNDYWHLQPWQTTDMNANRQQVAFDAFGRITGVAVMGKEHEEVGDALDNLPVILSDEEMETFLQDPCGPLSRRLLGHAGRRSITYLGRFHHQQRTRGGIVPSFTAELSCDKHYRDRDERPHLMISIAYLDGTGAPLQTTTLCQRATGASPAQWRISEWVIKDSKGNPVRVCQPSYAPDHHFRFEANIDSPKTTHLLDPLDRVVGILHADHTWSKVQMTPWSSVNYDVGSTVTVEDPALDDDIGPFLKTLAASEYLPTWLQQRPPVDPRTQAAEKSAVYAGKQSTTHVDARGNCILAQVVLGDGTAWSYRTEYDVAGHAVGHYDALARLIQQSQCDLLGRSTSTHTMDAGSTKALLDCAGIPLLHWTQDSLCFRHVYDALRRETELRMVDQDGNGEEVVLHRIEYGESDPQGSDRNLRGMVTRVQDQSGECQNVRFDFKGTCLQQSYRMATNYKDVLDWTCPVDLEEASHEWSVTVDAQGRPLQSVDASGCETWRSYDLAGSLKTIQTRMRGQEDTPRCIVSDITYGPDQHIQQIVYGNGATLDQTYDEVSRRLVRKVLSRTASSGVRDVVQDLHYRHDCTGRVIRKWDAAQPADFFRNSRTDAEWIYTYDALGQLVQATGREQIDNRNGAQCQLRAPGPRRRPVLGLQMCQYEERYRYDAAGNILSMHHSALNLQSVAGWTRRFQYAEESQLQAGVMGNRLTQTVTGGQSEAYMYGSARAGQRGCMTSMAGYSELTWDHLDHLRSSSRQISREGIPERTWYIYNMAGVRVRKVTERASLDSQRPRKMKERLFLPGTDIYRTFGGDGETQTREKTQCHITGASEEAVAVLESAGPARRPLLVRYQAGESLEIDDEARLISYEEYTPFGATVFFAAAGDVDAPRQYRYAAYERDRETGLYFCQNRYYAPWLGRWTSPDPLGLVDGRNLYRYVGNDPVNMYDPTGTVRRKGSASTPSQKFPNYWKLLETMRDEAKDGAHLDGLAPMKKLKTDAQRRKQTVDTIDSLRLNAKRVATNKKENADHVFQKAQGQKHHLLGRAWRTCFEAAGYDVDAQTIYIDQETHHIIGQRHDKAWGHFWKGHADKVAQWAKTKDPNGKKWSTFTEKFCNYIAAHQTDIQRQIKGILAKNIEMFGKAKVSALKSHMVSYHLTMDPEEKPFSAYPHLDMGRTVYDEAIKFMTDMTKLLKQSTVQLETKGIQLMKQFQGTFPIYSSGR